LDVWIIASKKIPFFISLFLTFPHFFSPLMLLSFMPPLECCLGLTCLATSLRYLILLPSSYHFITLLCFALFIASCCFIVSCLHALRYIVAWLFHSITLQIPIGTPICCFINLLSCTLLHCTLLPYTLCWLVLPSSFRFSKEELGIWRSKFSST
jgi:hypothetical protein